MQVYVWVLRTGVLFWKCQVQEQHIQIARLEQETKKAEDLEQLLISKFETYHADIIRYLYPREWDRMLLPGLSEVTFATTSVEDWGCFRNTCGVRRCTMYLSEVYLSGALFWTRGNRSAKSQTGGEIGQVTFGDIGFRSNSLCSRCLSTVVLS